MDLRDECAPDNVPPLLMNEEGNYEIEEQTHTKPFEDAGHFLIGIANDHEQEEDGEADACREGGDGGNEEIGDCSHTLDIGADIEDHRGKAEEQDEEQEPFRIMGPEGAGEALA